MTFRLASSAALIVVALLPGCAREVGSESSPDSATDSSPASATESSPDSAIEARVEGRATVAVLGPEPDGRRAFQTNLYSERDADVYNRLMIDETAGVGAPVTVIHVEVGDRVRAGELLATLDDADARIEVRAAEPEADIAASNLRRIEELRKTGVVSEAEHEEAVYRARKAEAALEKARLNLSRTEIRAPFAGLVSRRYVRVGDIVDDETPLFRVTAMAPLRARLMVPEGEVGSFGPGASLRITGADGTTGAARVILVGPTTDPGSGTREVVIELPKADGFRPGASVTAELVAEPEEASGS